MYIIYINMCVYIRHTHFLLHTHAQQQRIFPHSFPRCIHTYTYTYTCIHRYKYIIHIYMCVYIRHTNTHSHTHAHTAAANIPALFSQVPRPPPPPLPPKAKFLKSQIATKFAAQNHNRADF